MGGAKSNPASARHRQQAGFTQESFDACINDKAQLNKIQQVWNTASSKFQVDSTPTFFINGQKFAGEMPIEQFDKAIEQYIKG